MSKTYDAVVDVTFSKTISVEAENEDEARDKIEKIVEEISAQDIASGFYIVDKSVVDVDECEDV